MSISHLLAVVHGGAETVTDQLAGTIVEQVPQRGGKVRMAAVNTTAGVNTITLKAGSIVISDASQIPDHDNAIDRTQALWVKKVPGGRKLDLSITAAGASTTYVWVEIE